MRASITIVLLLAAVMPARAEDSFEDPDTQAARRHFQRGQQLYEQQRFADAVAEFTIARRIKPLPAFDYNIGRCYERLEEWGKAADAYERYLAEQPTAAEAATLRTRIPELRDRDRALHPQPVAAIVAPPPEAAVAHPRRARNAAIAVAALTVASFATAGGLLGSVAADFPGLQDYCTAHPCGEADIGGLRARRDAGYALLGIGGALAVTDVVLWIVHARQRARRF